MGPKSRCVDDVLVVAMMVEQYCVESNRGLYAVCQPILRITPGLNDFETRLTRVSYFCTIFCYALHHQYDPSSEAFSLTSDGKIVLRRIVCRIINAYLKWWKLPGLPFPTPKRQGYLDVIYLDKDIRVTKGNRGGLFVHMRPAYLEKVLSE